MHNHYEAVHGWIIIIIIYYIFILEHFNRQSSPQCAQITVQLSPFTWKGLEKCWISLIELIIMLFFFHQTKMV